MTAPTTPAPSATKLRRQGQPDRTWLLLIFFILTSFVLLVSHNSDWQNQLRLTGTGLLGFLQNKIVEALMVSLFLANILFAYLWRAAPWARALVGLGSLLFVLPMAGRSDTSLLDLSIQIMIFAALALGLNIVVGLAGLLDLGYVAFFAVGAYTWGVFGSPQFSKILSYYGQNPAAAAGPTLLFGAVLLILGGGLFNYLRKPAQANTSVPSAFMQSVGLLLAAVVAMFVGRAVFTGGGKTWSLASVILSAVLLALPPLVLWLQSLRGRKVAQALNNYRQFMAAILALMGLILVARAAAILMSAKAAGLATGIDPSFFWLFLAISIMAAAIVGVLIGLPVLKLKGDYLAIITLGLGEVIRVLANNLSLYTNGSQGITPIKSASVPWFDRLAGALGFSEDQYYLLFLYLLVLVVIVVILTVNIRLDKSRIGRAWIAIRDDEIAAQAMGVPLVQTKLIAFATGASFAGVMGMIFAAKQTFISPESFNLFQSIGVLSMVILGGMGSFPGVILGAAVVTLLNLRILPGLGEATSQLGIPQQVNPGQLQRLIFGAILVTMMLLRPEGLLPNTRRQLEMHQDEEAGDPLAALPSENATPSDPTGGLK